MITPKFPPVVVDRTLKDATVTDGTLYESDSITTQVDSLGSLLALRDEIFIRAAYRMILGRDPDAEGLKYYLNRMRQGARKMRILSQLRNSIEGRNYSSKVVGLDEALRREGRLGLKDIRLVLALKRERKLGLKDIGLAFHWLKMRGSSGRRLKSKIPDLSQSRINYKEWIERIEKPELPTAESVRATLGCLPRQPLISIVVPTFNTSEIFLRNCIDSVISQAYKNWELCIADDASSNPAVHGILNEYTKLDRRIRIVYREKNGHISAASNSALGIAQGDFVALLDHDDVLTEHALYYVVLAINRCRSAKVLYSDEDKIDSKGNRFDPHFKSDWNPDLFFSQNYVSHLCVYRRDLLNKVGGFRSGVEGSQDQDLLLRCLPFIESGEIIHIPRVLYHWRAVDGSTAIDPGAKSYTTRAGIKALKDYFSNCGMEGVLVTQGAVPNIYRIQWPIPTPAPLVSLLIPTRDNRLLVETCVRSILSKSTYGNFEILILDNGSFEPETLAFFREIQQEDTRVKVLRYDFPFNFSAINNFGVRHAKGEIIGLINNDVEVISPEWLSEMVGHACRPEIGCVGAKLYYGNDTLQHAGVICGIGGVASHSHKHFPKTSYGYFGRLISTQNYLAVTAACLLVRRCVFIEVGGLDEKNLAVAFNDVDFCLKVREAGYRNVWTPYAELYHYESSSRGTDDPPEKQMRFQNEVAFMRRKWGDVLTFDPYYNLNLTINREDFSIGEFRTMQNTILSKSSGLKSVSLNNELGNPQLDRNSIAGRFEKCELDLISGWVINTAAIDTQLEVEIVIDGMPAIVLTADRFREDLRKDGFANGNHGFEWKPASAIFKSKKYHVEVRERSSGHLLSGSPRNLLGYNYTDGKSGSGFQFLAHLGNATSSFPYAALKHSLDDCSHEDRMYIVAEILNSGFFDLGYYAQQIKRGMEVMGLVEHYLLKGASEGRRPMVGFEANEYRDLNPDVPKLTDAGYFVHYVLFGSAEKRYYSYSKLRFDASIICTNQDFNVDWYARFEPCLRELTVEEHYLAEGWRKGFTPNRNFDANFYLSCYVDARRSAVPPFLHYMLHNTGRFQCLNDAQAVVRQLSAITSFDAEYYHARYGKYISKGIPDIVHYYCEGERLNFDPNEKFSAEYYRRKYGDLSSAKVCLFEHYYSNGVTEGRKSKFNSKSYIRAGGNSWNPRKPTILVVCHEASRTGAPILGGQLVEKLNQNVNVISWLVKKGTLLNYFIENSAYVICGDMDHTDSVWMARELITTYKVHVAILNSVATCDVASVLWSEKIPIVALVHEYADYMESAVLQMMLFANRVVFPAYGVKESADKLCVKSFGMVRSNATVRHQGHCVPPKEGSKENSYTKEQILQRLYFYEIEQEPVIVLGCGWVQMRKGVEFFIEAARYCKKMINRPIRFLWVGGGYRPDTDLHYSAWLRSQIINSGLEENVIFFEETEDLNVFFELADVFFLSSRLDPFPNVAIDAIVAKVPIVAFERATGITDFIAEHPSVGATVPFLDVEGAAKAIQRYVSGEYAQPTMSEAILKQLSFSSYADFVWDECQAAISHQRAVDEESELLIDSKIMDAEFFKSAHFNWQSIMPVEYIYVSQWSRGIKTAKSRVGFNDILAEKIQADMSVDKHPITPLARVLESLTFPLTHKTIYMDQNSASESLGSTQSVALHIHAYYIEGLPRLLRRFGELGRRVWLYITTDTEEKAKVIKAMSERLLLEANIMVVPNRGRDVGPFIMGMKEYLWRFDVVGHFHLKGTKQLESKVVNAWQDFIFNSLIGNHGELAHALLCTFERDTKLGFCFQEDPCLPSWGKNKELAAALLVDLAITRPTPDVLEYPTGNMFWARTAALAPLLQRDWRWSDFPPEPIPYDGSILHALERLTPIICEVAGYEWRTVHIPSARRYSSSQ